MMTEPQNRMQQMMSKALDEYFDNIANLDLNPAATDITFIEGAPPAYKPLTDAQVKEIADTFQLSAELFEKDDE